MEEIQRNDAILRERCDEIGRDHDEIEKTMTDWICIRDDAAEARRVLEGLAKANGDTLGPDEHVLVGTPEQIADELRPVRRARASATSSRT